MKKFSILLIVLGLIFIIGGTIPYGHHQNVDDTSGSAVVVTLSGHWTEKIPAFFGGVMLLFGASFYYVVTDEERKKKLVI